MGHWQPKGPQYRRWWQQKVVRLLLSVHRAPLGRAGARRETLTTCSPETSGRQIQRHATIAGLQEIRCFEPLEQDDQRVDVQRGVTTLTELHVPLGMHDRPARRTVNGRAEKYLSPNDSADGYVPGSTCLGVDRVYDRPTDRGNEVRIAQRLQDFKGAPSPS